ncbi:MAG: hypothetical protein ACJAXR_001176 [Halopseudomonas sp.]|uniref:hypothetical protein n=1 Tax=Halopseudomonas sp. TaxID=2901191 RepID=UPI0039E48913
MSGKPAAVHRRFGQNRKTGKKLAAKNWGQVLIIALEKMGSGLAYCPAENPAYPGIVQAKVVANNLQGVATTLISLQDRFLSIRRCRSVVSKGPWRRSEKLGSDKDFP